MIAITLDLLAAFLIARWRAPWWGWLPLCLLAGVVISLAVHVAAHFLFSGMFSVHETMKRAIAGAFWHPLICASGSWFMRRVMKRPVQ